MPRPGDGAGPRRRPAPLRGCRLRARQTAASGVADDLPPPRTPVGDSLPHRPDARLRAQVPRPAQRLIGDENGEVAGAASNGSALRPSTRVALRVGIIGREPPAGRPHEMIIPPGRVGLERAKGIEPSYEAWEASVLPLNYARI